ncbi:MAG: cell division protein ZipA C-terminal FtsZ-binding domain-containing protein [Francisellaceae bacterium]
MNQVQIILLLSIIIVILLLIDAIRRSRRKKFKRQLSEIKANEKKAQQQFQEAKVTEGAVGVDSATDEQQSQISYPVLKQGYALLYISAPRGYVFNGGDLSALFGSFSLELNKEGAYQSFTDDGDVLFSIVPDNEAGRFDIESVDEIELSTLVAVMNINKLKHHYDALSCFDHFINTVHELNEKLGGMILSETRRRFTSNDESVYRFEIRKLKSQGQDHIASNSIEED